MRTEFIPEPGHYVLRTIPIEHTGHVDINTLQIESNSQRLMEDTTAATYAASEYEGVQPIQQRISATPSPGIVTPDTESNEGIGFLHTVEDVEINQN